MSLRAATDADRDAVLALGVAEEAAWFGEPDVSAAEIAEGIDDEGGLAAGVVAAGEDGRVHGFASPGRRNAVPLADPARIGAVAGELLPWLRGQVSQQKRFIGTVQDDAKILRFVNSKDAPRLAGGKVAVDKPSAPLHFSSFHMSILLGILTFVLILVSIFLVLVVLMQKSKDGGMGAALGGGAAEAAFGADTSNVLTQATKYSAILFFVLAFTLYLGRLYERAHGTSGGRALPTIAAPATPAPTAPSTGAPASTTTPTTPAVSVPVTPAPATSAPATPAPTTTAPAAEQPAPEPAKK